MYYRLRQRIENEDDITIGVQYYDNLRELVEDLYCLIQNCKENNIDYKDQYYIEDEDFNVIFVS